MYSYFRLKPYCYFEKGKGNSCIYNLLDGTVMIVNNEEMCKLIEQCEQNKTLENITEVDRKFLNNLVDMGIGDFYKRPIYVEKLSVGIPTRLENTLPGNYEIPTVFIEISNTCNLDCIFCPENDNTLFRKTGCKRWKLNGEPLSIQQWEQVIKQVSKLSCERVFLIGGEPFLEFRKLKTICSFLVQYGIKEIYIYTNGALINNEIINFLKDYSIQLRVQILGPDNAVYKKITGLDNVETTVNANIQKLYRENIPMDISCLVSRYNEEDIETLINKYKGYSLSGRVKLEFIYPVPENNHYSKKYRKRMYDKKKDLEGACLNVTKFTNVQKQHNCYANQIAITASGDILPCIMSRKFVIGNVKQYGIVEILKNSKYEYYRGINKKVIDKCCNCALKYACFDCRAFEYSATGKVLGMEYCDVEI